MSDLRSARRLVWRHKDSGSISVMGEGLASNTRTLTTEDVHWLNDQLPTLQFALQEWDGDDWVEVTDDE